MRFVFIIFLFPVVIFANEDLKSFVKKGIEFSQKNMTCEDKIMAAFYVGEYTAYSRILLRMEGYSDDFYPDNF